jgi:predicted aminopeptidase
MWRYNDTKTMKWRVDAEGRDFYRPWEEAKKRRKEFEAQLSKIDDEVRQLMLEEKHYRDMGGSAAQWEELHRKKENLRLRKGKTVPPVLR